MAAKKIKGAGGTEGGIGRFFIGFVMLVAGGYLFFNAIQIRSGFHMGYALYSFGGFNVTSGMVLVPLIFGIGIIFYNAKNVIGWLLSVGSLVAMIFGVISPLRFSFRGMSAFDLITIFVLFFGGLGLFLSSLRNLNKGGEEEGE